MQVTMQPAPNDAAAASGGGGGGSDAIALEIERMRLHADQERDREARRERTREAREERRREREVDRERRRELERQQRIEDDRRRAEHEAQQQAMLFQALKEITIAQRPRENDPLIAAMLAKLNQPDPLVLKLLDGHGRREDLTDFVKAQVESMRMASSLQTDSLRQVMNATQEVQSQLIRQAVDLASNRGESGWDGLGTVLSATAGIIAAMKGGPEPGHAPVTASAPPARRVRVVRSETAFAPRTVPGKADATGNPGAAATAQRPATQPAPAPAYTAPMAPSDPTEVVGILRDLRAMQRGELPDDDESLQVLCDRMPDELAEAILASEPAAIQNAVIPAIQQDPTLGQWLAEPVVAVWIGGFVERIQTHLVMAADASEIATESKINEPII